MRQRAPLNPVPLVGIGAAKLYTREGTGPVRFVPCQGSPIEGVDGPYLSEDAQARPVGPWRPC